MRREYAENEVVLLSEAKHLIPNKYSKERYQLS